MKLRTAVLVLAVLTALSGAGVTLASRGRQGMALVGVGVLGVLAIVFERWRYRKRLPPAARWIPTGERFEDPVTGEPMEVLYDPASGERRYEPMNRRSP